MERVKIYLSGAMTGVSFEDQTKWRNKIANAIKYGGYDYTKTPIFFDPTKYYVPSETFHKSEKEAMNFDLYNLRNSNLMIVNFNSPSSIGTAMELMLAKELKIPVIGINSNNEDIHSWLLECVDRMCDDIREVVEYTVEYFLN